MKPRSAVIFVIVAFATCGDRAPAQFPGCAYIELFNPCPINIEAQGDCEPIIDRQEACKDCEPGAAAWWVVNDRRDGDGEVKVTIRVTLWDAVLGTSTFTDQMLTLAGGKRRKLGCSLPTAQTRYTWSVEDCQPRSPQAYPEKQLTPTEKKFADAQRAFFDHIEKVWYENMESRYRQLVPGTARVQLSISPEGELVSARVLSNGSNELAAQLIIDAIRPAIGLLAPGKSSEISAEITAFGGEGSDLYPRDKRPSAMIRVSQGGLGYPYESSASFSSHDVSELNGLRPK